jgi:hypothetical protein
MKLVLVLFTVISSLAFANGDNYELELEALNPQYNEQEQYSDSQSSEELRMTCKCVALDANQFLQAACNALPVARCSRIGDVICYPQCSY